jgi:hypothetical protein
MEAQEIRNVGYRGELNDLIYELAENQFLRQRLKIRNERSPAYRVMSDAEFVLRFFTLVEKWQPFSCNYREEMNEIWSVTAIQHLLSSLACDPSLGA